MVATSSATGARPCRSCVPRCSWPSSAPAARASRTTRPLPRRGGSRRCARQGCRQPRVSTSPASTTPCRPGDDFDGYANGAWRARPPISRRPLQHRRRFRGVPEGREAQRRADPGAGRGQSGRRHRRAPHRRLLRRLHGPGRHRDSAVSPPLQRRRSTRSTRSPDGTDALARARRTGLRADVDPLNATNFATEHLFGVFVAQGLEDPAAQRRLPAAGRPGHAEPRLLPVDRQGHGRDRATSTRPTSPRC